MITNLKENQVFVFGSNELGEHIGGAAKQALQFGAINGVGEGLMEQSYAFPTLDRSFQKRSRNKLMVSVYKLYMTCKQNPNKEFLLTKVGCGIAGFEEKFMAKLFRNAPSNLVSPEGWNIYTSK